MKIGKLEKVELRDIWEIEAKDFTSGLYENLEGLSDSIDLTLIVPEQMLLLVVHSPGWRNSYIGKRTWNGKNEWPDYVRNGLVGLQRDRTIRSLKSLKSKFVDTLIEGISNNIEKVITLAIAGSITSWQPGKSLLMVRVGFRDLLKEGPKKIETYKIKAMVLIHRLLNIIS